MFVGRRGVQIWLIGMGLSAIGAGPHWVASLALVSHMEVWASCALKTTSLLINFVIGDGFCGHQMVEAFVEVEANVRRRHAM